MVTGGGQPRPTKNRDGEIVIRDNRRPGSGGSGRPAPIRHSLAA
jgi:hypothetical protein